MTYIGTAWMVASVTVRSVAVASITNLTVNASSYVVAEMVSENSSAITTDTAAAIGQARDRYGLRNDMQVSVQFIR